MHPVPVRLRFVCFCLLALSLAGAPVVAQDFRGSITGRIADSSGARLPGATVTATNVETNVDSPTTTNGEGSYTISYLTPGTYKVTVEMSGFKKLVREGIEVRVGDKITLDLALDVGRVEETVAVRAESPLLELSTASTGQVIDEKRIALLPLADGNPFVLSRFVPGIAFNGELLFTRPFDNGGSSAIAAGGATGGNEFTLDGSPNMANGRRVAFVPPAGAVQEFKVETTTFDASDGHTAGATVNVMLKSGTNSLRGESYYYVRDEKRSAADFFVNRAGREKPVLDYDRFGGNVGGPIRFPRLYNGRDRTFFFGAVEWLYDEQPEPLSQTVPTAAMRNGDFSALLPNTVIFNPFSARQEGARVVRDPFTGNIIPPGLINPIAREALKYYPLPNVAGDAQGRNNFFYTNPRSDDFYSISLRVDHRLTDKQQIFVRYTRNDRTESRNAIYGEVNGVVPRGNFLIRKNDGLTYDHVYTMSPSSLFNVRAGWQRFNEPNIRQHEGIFDPASLGFSSTTVGFFGNARYFPLFDLNSFSDVGENIAATTIHSIYSFQPTYTHIAGRHSVRGGYDLRLYKERGSEPANIAGSYTFENTYTRAQDNSASGTFGQDLASFLLGLPTGGSINRPTDRLNYTWYHALFVQDDWKATEKLTVNLGLRYDYETPTTEANNRNARGFDPTAAISIAAAARAAYAASPIPEVAASAFNVQGGLQFASDSDPGFWDADRNNFQPRAGFAYAINNSTVIRGGWGIYTVPNIIFGSFQPGFARTTPIVVSQDTGLTFRANLTNPWPDGVLEPVGAGLGADTLLGQDISRFAPTDLKNARNMRYSIGAQRELPGHWLVEGAYVGSRGWDLTTGGGNQAGEIDLNGIPRQYLSTSRQRDDVTNNFLTANVANPFRGLMPTAALNGATVQRQQLLRPFPQFGANVRTWASDGTSRYQSAQFKLEKRFTQGYTILAGYTRSKYTERVFKLNPTDTEYEERLSQDDVPHRFVLSGIWELPFGRDRHWGSGANRLMDGVIGGWSLQAVGQIQSGRPISFHDRNIYFNGDLNNLKTDYSGDSNDPVFDISGFYFHDAPVQTNGVDDPAKQRLDQRIRLVNNIRYFPSRVPGLRGQAVNLWDISLVKQVRFNDRVRAQFHIEFLNAFNHPIFNNPNTDPTNADFGKVTSQANLPRDIQLAAKIVF